MVTWLHEPGRLFFQQKEHAVEVLQLTEDKHQREEDRKKSESLNPCFQRLN